MEQPIGYPSGLRAVPGVVQSVSYCIVDVVGCALSVGPRRLLLWEFVARLFQPTWL